MQKETMGQLLPFAQSAQTLRRFAGKHTAQGNDLQAVELLRLSMQRGAADDETALSLAEAYASLQCYTLSNRVLIPRISSPEVGERCLFGAACNMMSLGMTECARDCAVMYLHDYPDGDWAPDAVEIVEACEEPEEKLPDAQERVEKRVQRALNALNEDKPGLAVRLLGRALTVGRRDSGVHSLLAFALLARGDAKGAVSAARQALRLAKGDLRAQCAMAAALYAVGTKNAARSFLDRAASAVRDEDEAMLVCHTACEMDAPEVVVSVLRETENDAPYSDELLHLMACAYYNAGNREEATRRWKLIRRVNPADAVAEYRLRLCEEGTLPEKLPYTCRLPLTETLRRLGTLRRMVEEGIDSLQARLDGDAPDDGLEALLQWALASDEPGVANAAVRVLLAFHGPRAQALLQGVLADISADDSLKHEALAALCVMSAKGPFYVVIGGRMSIVHVSRMNEKKNAAHGSAFFNAACKRAGAETDAEKRILRALCEKSAHLRGIENETVRRQVVALAYRMTAGQGGVTLRAPQKRRMERLARRLMREVAKDGMY